MDHPHEETLSRFEAGDLDADDARAIAEHIAACKRCRARIDALRGVDRALRHSLRRDVPAGAVLETRRRLTHELRGGPEPEIMTLKEAAAFLRVSLDEIGELLETLPAFELAGQVRIRRTRLVAWIEERERVYRRAQIEHEIAASAKAIGREDDHHGFREAGSVDILADIGSES